MRKLILLFVLLLGSFAFGQITTTQVLNIKEVTEVQRDALTIAANEFPIIYNTTSNQHEKYNGSTWEALGSAEVNDLNTVTWVNVPDANITESSVTQHEAALTITGANITTGSIPLTDITDGAYGSILISSGVASLGTNSVDNNVLAVASVQSINIQSGTIDEVDLDASVNASLDLADSSLQSVPSNSVGTSQIVNGSVNVAELDTDNTVIAGQAMFVSGTSTIDNRDIVENDISDLSHTPEGTAILSTGETGGTKYLREDGDGTSSWQTVAGGGGDDVSGFSEKTGALVGTDRLVGLSSTTDFNETISGIPLSIFNDDLTHATDTDEQDLGVSGNNVTITDGTSADVSTTTAVTANTAKVTNATHTGDATGSTVLTIATDAVDIAMLSATGTASSSTYLRGDNTWATPSGSSLPTTDTTSLVEGSADATKEMRIEVDGLTTGTTRVITMPDYDVDLGNMMTTTVGEPSGSDRILNVVSLTQAEYDAGTPVSTTMYIITNAKQELKWELPLTVIGGDIVVDTFVNYIPVHDAVTITRVKAHLNTAPTGSVATFDINEDGTSILSTKLTIDATEFWSDDAATQAVISDTAIDAKSVLSVDVDGIGSTIAGANGTVTIYYTVD